MGHGDAGVGGAAHLVGVTALAEAGHHGFVHFGSFCRLAAAVFLPLVPAAHAADRHYADHDRGRFVLLLTILAVSLSFSSFPPGPSGKTLENCKWHEESAVRMYVVPNGPNLALGQDVSANRLDCGHHTEDEKNWIAFTHENELHYIYEVEPHIVVKANAADGACEQVYNATSEPLQDLASRVSVRGSATAVRYSDSEYVALLHTKEKSTSEGGYTTRAYKFEARPPFRVIQVSKPFLAN